MACLTRNRIREAYRELGRVLDDPKAFGLSEGSHRELVCVLGEVRRKLMDELMEQKELGSDEDRLITELSQDADKKSFPIGKDHRKQA